MADASGNCLPVRGELEGYAPAVDLPLDPGIREAVLILRSQGVRTVESCQGGPGHACPEPVVMFEGTKQEAVAATRIAINAGLPVIYLRQAFAVDEIGALAPPCWELVFCPSMTELER